MHEDVLAGLGGDEAEAIFSVEPLHGSNSHGVVPPSIVLEVSITPGPWWRRRQGTSSTVRYKSTVNLCRATVAGVATMRYYAGQKLAGREQRQDFNRDRGDHPPTGSCHAGRPADPPSQKAPVARSRPRPARCGRPGPIRQDGRPRVGGSPPAPDPRATRPLRAHRTGLGWVGGPR